MDGPCAERIREAIQVLHVVRVCDRYMCTLHALRERMLIYIHVYVLVYIVHMLCCIYVLVYIYTSAL